MIKFILDNGLALGLFGATVLLVILGIGLKKLLLKQLAYNLAAVFFAFFVYELYLDFSHNGKQKTITVNGEPAISYGDYHPELGYAPRKDSLDVQVVCRKDDQFLYQVQYGLRDGRRRIPEDEVEDTAFVAFMGGSFTFGEGLNDEETLAAQFNQITGGHFKTINCGFHGYGPHHALRMLDKSFLQNKMDSSYRCRLAVYLFIPDHVRRAAGYASWDFNGPKYTLRADSLISSGQFSGENNARAAGNKIQRALNDMWHRSAIAHKHFRKEKIDVDERDLALTLAIFEQLDKAWSAQKVDFILLLDPAVDEWPWRENFQKALEQRGITSILLSDIFSQQDDLYIEGDGHPTAIYNQILAEYLSNEQVPYLCHQQQHRSWKH